VSRPRRGDLNAVDHRLHFGKPLKLYVDVFAVARQASLELLNDGDELREVFSRQWLFFLRRAIPSVF
jgi:hypothetical protein